VNAFSGYRNNGGISLNKSAEKLMGLASGLDHDVVVAHLLEKTVADQTVTA
jgi:hypothetical protein